MAKAKAASKKFTQSRATVKAPRGVTESNAAAHQASLGDALGVATRAHLALVKHNEETERALAAERDAHTATSASATETIQSLMSDHDEQVGSLERERDLTVARLDGEIKLLKQQLEAQRQKLAQARNAAGEGYEIGASAGYK